MGVGADDSESEGVVTICQLVHIQRKSVYPLGPKF